MGGSSARVGNKWVRAHQDRLLPFPPASRGPRPTKSSHPFYVSVRIGGAVIGLLFGAVAGYGSVKDDWQPLPVTARDGVVPAGRGRALVVALSLPARRR
jgi:hypothetical protein